RHARGAAPAWRPVVLRRILRRLAAARMSTVTTHAATTAPPLVPSAEPSEAARIAEFVRRASFEATRPSDSELDALQFAAAPGTRIYLSALASRDRKSVV